MDNQSVNKSSNPIQSADRIFAILEALAEHGSMRIIDLSELLDLHKSTVHRLLASLISMGYVTQNELTGAYALTYKLVEMAGKILKNADILNLIRPYAEQLSNSCDETIHFVKKTGNNVLYLEKLESQSVKARSFRLSSQVGLTRPMYCSGVGKVILAYLPETEVEQIWNSSDIVKKTAFTITDFREFKKHCGMSPAKFQMHCRLHNAAAMLRRSASSCVRFCLASRAVSLVNGLPLGNGCPFTGDTGRLLVSVINQQLLFHTVDVLEQVTAVVRACGFEFLLGGADCGFVLFTSIRFLFQVIHRLLSHLRL